jgi:4-aminobutyrate aminotransferase-like enzyme
LSQAGSPRPALLRGDLLPAVEGELPGPRSRAASKLFAELEAPGINTLYGGEPNLVWQEALGSCVTDLDGNRFLDFTSGFGVAAIGHRHPRVVAAIREQSERLVHGLGDAIGHPGRLALAARLRELAPWPAAARTQVYFAVSGADAVEIALKTALLHRRGRSRVAVFEPSYHGLSLGALAATSRPAFRDPFAAHLHAELSRFPFGRPLGNLRHELEKGRFAAVMVEPVVGREGALFPPAGWLAELAEICRATGTLLACDEIFTGFGRCGHLFASAGEGVVPDLLCCGKALGGGLPIAAVLAPAEILAAWATPGEALHTGTFVAHPLACAAALAALSVIEEEGLAERAKLLGEEIAPRIEGWLEHKELAAVRGRGLFFGLEFASRELAGRFQQAAWRNGVLLLAGGPEGKVAQLSPPLTIARPQLEAALEALELALRSTDRVRE